MNTRKFSKIYESMDYKQQAAITFKFLSEGKTDEADKVFDSVPVALYECIEQKYMQRLQGLMYMSDYWAVNFWKAYAKHLAVIVGFRMFMEKGDRETALDLIGKSDDWRAKIVALELVLDRMEIEHGVDAEAVRRFAGTPEGIFERDDPDEEYLKETERDLIQLIER